MSKTVVLELYDLIQNIQKRPAMYLGQPSISHLRTFLAGYFFARRQLGAEETPQEQQFTNFQAWIKEKFQITSSQSWDKIILFFSQDEHKALEYFFQLFHEFYQNHEMELNSSATTKIKSPTS